MPSVILSDNGVSSGSAGIKTTADSTGSLALQTTTAAGVATTAVTIDTSQNVGIGTASPNSKLTVGTASYGQAASVAQINGTSIATTNSGGILNIGCTDAAAADVGGSLGFTANGGINGYPLGQISGRRESATSSNYSSYLAFTTSNSGGSISERMRIDSSGNLLVGVASANANGGVLQLKSGITFPATQVAATDANTLDDYEEGSWTPAQGSGLTVVGAFSSAGRYTKIGSTAFLQGSVTGATSVACTNGGAITSNLPFTSTTTVVGIGGFTNAAGTAGGTTDCGPSSTSMAATPAITATTTIYFSLTYQTT